MQKIIKIGDKEVALRSDAAIPYRYEQIFKEDFFDAIETLNSGGNTSKAIDTVYKLGYVMAMKAAGVDLTTLDKEKFITWLEGFEPSDISDAAADIAEAYASTSKGTIDPK